MPELAPAEQDFFRRLEEAVQDSRTTLSPPSRAHVLIVTVLAIIDGQALQTNHREATKEEFLRICGWAYDKIRGNGGN